MALLFNRREWLATALMGSSLLALRSAASGIPVNILADPQKNLLLLNDESVSRIAANSRAQYLVVSATDDGEPMNCNAPGTYDDARILHSSAASLAPATFTLGDKTVTAASIWGTMPPSGRQRCSFFHHGTYAFAHGDLHNVYTLQNRVPNQDELVAAIAAANSEALGTIQAQPIALSATGGSELISAQGIRQPMFSPLAIKAFLSTPASLSSLGKTQSLRDRDLDSINALLKSKGTNAQKGLLDHWASSQRQARALSQNLLAGINGLSDNSAASQLTAAALLFALKVTPAAVVKLRFGGDNHTDNDGHLGIGPLPAEEGEHRSSVTAINSFLNKLSDLGIADSVTLATLSTFGRTNCTSEFIGRAHNGLHACNLIMGKNVRGGVVGGVELIQGNLKATGIDSASGYSANGGDVPHADTLMSYGATLGAACGLDDATIADKISPGRIVKAAIS